MAFVSASYTDYWTRESCPCATRLVGLLNSYSPPSPSPSPPHTTTCLSPCLLLDPPPPPTADPECRQHETDQTMPEDAMDAFVITARYQLPADLTCERCILQMVHCELVLGHRMNVHVVMGQVLNTIK